MEPEPSSIGANLRRSAYRALFSKKPSRKSKESSLIDDADLRIKEKTMRSRKRRIPERGLTYHPLERLSQPVERAVTIENELHQVREQRKWRRAFEKDSRKVSSARSTRNGTRNAKRSGDFSIRRLSRLFRNL